MSHFSPVSPMHKQKNQFGWVEYMASQSFKPIPSHEPTTTTSKQNKKERKKVLTEF